MEHYLLEAALLMLAAYLVGAILGCLLRRALSPIVSATATAPPELATKTAKPSSPAAAAAASIREAPEPIQPRIETVANPTPPQEAKVAEAARFERALTSAPPAAAASAAAVAAASHQTSDPSPLPRLPAASSGTGTPAVAASIAAPADDLRNINGIAAGTANQLNQLGYTRFSQIADWTPNDISRVRTAVGVSSAHSGTWIEQARILADGKQTGHLRRLSDGAPTSPWALVGVATAAAIAATIAAPAAIDPGPADLSRIEGIDENTAELLSENGIASYDQIAHWTTGDVERFDTLLRQRGRVSRQNWIEQAKILADGKQTAFNRRMSMAPTPVTAPSGLLAPQPLAASIASSRSAAVTATTAATAASSAAGAVAEASTQPDDLKLIRGVDPNAEKILHGEGISTFAQLAAWRSADVHNIDSLLAQPGRASEQNWIEQAKILADGKQTAFIMRQASRPNVIQRPGSIAAAGGIAIAALRGEPPSPPAPVEVAPPTTSPVIKHALTEPNSEFPQRQAPGEQVPRPARLADAIRQNTASLGTLGAPPASGVTGMRSVRSQLLSGDETAKLYVNDDLKKIRGIGVLIEKKLNAMGVYSYEQIANWSSEEIQHVSSALDFKGRIEREGWVQQARILASGGQTEFSKRLN